jgi:hypothetical protein
LTQLEIRAMLARVDVRQLRKDAGIRQVTVARALGVRQNCVCKWERRDRLPYSPAGLRWVAFVAGLERHAQVTAELAAAAAEMDEAA